MKRGGPLRRYTPLAPGAPLARGKSLARTGGLARRAPTRTVPAPRVADEVRQQVYQRARLRCERCGVDLSTGGGEVHHRRPAGAGGSTAVDSHTLVNLVLLCWPDHRWVESFRELALEQGWLVVQGADPAGVAVLVHGVGWVLLSGAGPTYRRVDA